MARSDMASEAYTGLKPQSLTPPKRQQQLVSGATLFLFLIFVAYTACPIFQVPGLDLSFSALIMVFIALNVFLGSNLGGFKDCKGWLLLAMAFWLGIVFSLLGNVFLGSKASIDIYSWKNLLNYSYWIFVFITTAFIASRSYIWPRLVKVLVAMILLVAILRWAEAILFGRLVGGTKILTPNGYGGLFSTFSPFVLALLFSRRSGGRWPAVLVAIIVWGAVAINSSRGAWISVGFGVVCFMGLYLRAHPRRVMALFGVIIIGGLLAGFLMLAPDKYMRATSARFDSFRDLERDKSISTRKLMVQKGWRLFRENPICGIGVGGFTRAFAHLDTDRADVSQVGFNKRSAHNSYIALLAETGLAGTLPFAVLLFSLIFRGYKAAVRLARQEEIWALGVYVGFLMMSLHLWVLSGLTSTQPWVIYGLVVAMIITAGRATGGDALEEKAAPKHSR